MRELRTIFKEFICDVRGGVLIYGALVLPVLIGASAMAVDVATWHVHRRSVQVQADSAAIAGALEVMRDSSITVRTVAELDAAKNGWGQMSGDTMPVAETPPTTGPNTGLGGAVEVIIRRNVPTMLTSLFRDAPVTVQGRAVALAATKDSCIWSLNKTDADSLTVSGGAVVALDCGAMVNSSDPGALDESGSGCFSATTVKIAGGYTGDCVNTAPVTGVPPASDPLAYLTDPDTSWGCDVSGAPFTIGPSEFAAAVTAHPADPYYIIAAGPGGDAGGYGHVTPEGEDIMVFCSNVTIQAFSAARFERGIYVMKGAAFTINAGAKVRSGPKLWADYHDGVLMGDENTVTPRGVLFYLTNLTNINHNISFQSGADIAFSAMDTGKYAGILVFQNRTSMAVTHSFTGGATMDLDGVIYTPTSDIFMAGGSSTNPLNVTIIADQVAFNGNVYIDANISYDDAAAAAGLGGATLIE